MRKVVQVDEPIDSATGIKNLRESIAQAVSSSVESITLWAWWPLGAATFVAKYKYAVTCVDLEKKTELYTNIYTIQIPLDSAEGMAAFLQQLPNAAPLFVYPLRPDPQEQFTFPKFPVFSAN